MEMYDPHQLEWKFRRKSRTQRLAGVVHRVGHLISRSGYFQLIKCSLCLYLLVDVLLNVLLMLFGEEMLEPLRHRLARHLPAALMLCPDVRLLRAMLACCLLLDLLGLLAVLLNSVPLALLNVYHLALAMLKLALAFGSVCVLFAHLYFVILSVVFVILLPHRKWRHT